MPKQLSIHPKDVRKPGKLTFKTIELNKYQKSVADVVGEYSKEDLMRVYHDMFVIRTFENMLNEIKLNRVYKGIEYNHAGPAHLSIGQEASVVGQSFYLSAEDHIYGSHRSHGEILAKGMSSISKMDDADLMKLMSTFKSGDILKVVEKSGKNSVKELALDYLLYGAMAEIFARLNGFNWGMGGSMHAFFTPFGIFPNNAIVGGSGTIATGAALYKRINKKDGIVICNIGDASIGCGPVWEGLCFANMDQFKGLWDEAHRGGLPLIMNFMNNFYGMGGQPVGETMGFKVLARLGAGLNPEQMHAERIDGYNPLAVMDAVKRKRAIIEKGDGPVLLDTLTYRFSGHSPSDASSYRTKEEVDEWRNQDSLVTYAQQILDAKLATEAEIKAIETGVEDAIFANFKLAVDLDVSPRANLMMPGNLLEQTMFSNQRVESLDTTRKPECLIPLAENPRVKRLASRSRSGKDANGAAIPKGRCIGIRDGLFEAIIDSFYTDPTLVAYGEENRDWGGAFAVYQGLTEALPYHRLFNSPISEAAIVGTGVGYCLEGGRAIVELMYCDFMGRAGDEIFNQMAKWQSMSGGVLRMPLVLRVSVGSKYGAQHSQDWTAIVAHIPGLKVVFPATPYDAKGLMYSSLTGTDPVVFLESQRIYDMSEMFHEGGVPEGRYEIPIGEPDVKREGSDITILTVGAILYRALETADILQKEYGISAEIIDARSIVPFNYDLVIESVKKTGNIMLASDACERGSFLHNMASKISQFAFDELDSPPVVIGARNWITPADEVEDAFFPFPADMLDAIHTHIMPLPGYTTKRPCDNEEMNRRSQLGV
ncbi:MAG: alpha-ketoacid dehydrogenase subunit alpha/beta [Armatimonadota bacterium]